jgi:hypothetical protein
MFHGAKNQGKSAEGNKPNNSIESEENDEIQDTVDDVRS